VKSIARIRRIVLAIQQNIVIEAALHGTRSANYVIIGNELPLLFSHTQLAIRVLNAPFIDMSL